MLKKSSPFKTKPEHFYKASWINVLEIINIDFSRFGKKVKSFREEKGISQEELAFETGLHRTYISDIERFKRSIALENVQKIADALEIETYKLFIEENETTDE